MRMMAVRWLHQTSMASFTVRSHLPETANSIIYCDGQTFSHDGSAWCCQYQATAHACLLDTGWVLLFADRETLLFSLQLSTERIFNFLNALSRKLMHFYCECNRNFIPFKARSRNRLQIQNKNVTMIFVDNLLKNYTSTTISKTRGWIGMGPNKINAVFPVANGVGKIRVGRSEKYFILFKNFILTNSWRRWKHKNNADNCRNVVYCRV